MYIFYRSGCVSIFNNAVPCKYCEGTLDTETSVDEVKGNGNSGIKKVDRGNKNNWYNQRQANKDFQKMVRSPLSDWHG